jgi:hypothetical protein
MKTKYNWILMTSNLSPCSYEGENIAAFCDSSIITLREESIQDLMEWLKKYPKKPIAILMD